MSVFYQPAIPEGLFILSPEESRHALKVLRLTVGDEIELTDGKGNFYRATITDADPMKCSFKVIKRDPEAARLYRIHIAVAPTKNIDRTEWFVGKAVEIGIDEISLMECKNSERTSVNLARMEKLMVSAMKQSKRATLPKLNPVSPFNQIIKIPSASRYIAYVDPENSVHLKTLAVAGGQYLILIGPEGDFSIAELDAALAAGFQKVSLGPNRLRVETAALTACLTLNLLNQ